MTAEDQMVVRQIVREELNVRLGTVVSVDAYPAVAYPANARFQFPATSYPAWAECKHEFMVLGNVVRCKYCNHIFSITNPANNYDPATPKGNP